MKVIIILLLLLLASPAFAQLTKEDVRTIFKEEITASEKRLREYIDLKIENVNARIDALDKKIGGVEKNLDSRINDIRIIMIALLGLITAAIAIPQIIIAYRESGKKEMQSQIDQLRKQIEAMQTPSS